MRVRVLYFGVLKEIFGREDEVVELNEGSDVAGLLAMYRRRGRAPGSLWESLAVAVNQEYARAGDLLRDGDEVALLPPVSGGLETKSIPQGLKPLCLRKEKKRPKAEALGYLEARARAQMLQHRGTSKQGQELKCLQRRGGPRSKGKLKGCAVGSAKRRFPFGNDNKKGSSKDAA